MTDEMTPQVEIEPERYELHAPPSFRFEVDRRDFCKILGGGVLIAVTVGRVHAQESGRARAGGRRIPDEIGAWLRVGEDGTVTVYTGKVEVGQDIRTSLAQVVAEELRVPMASIQMIMGDTDQTPFDMGTFGSMTTRVMSPQLRKAAAAAREVLVELAAQRLNTEAGKLKVEAGKVTDPANKQSIGFGQLTKGQRITKAIPANIELASPDHWTVAGKPALKVGAESIVTGNHRYPSDIQRPGMLYGKVLRPASFSATLVSADTKEAEAMPGVKLVRDGDFIGVAAPSAHAARRAIAAIRAKWTSNPQVSGGELFDHLRKTASHGRGGRGSSFTQGSIEEGLASSAQKLNQSYTIAYIAHTPLEPRAAVAEWTDGKLTVWTGTQRPFGVKGELAEAFRIPEERVRVIMPDTGSGYGGKHTGECAIEAARLAKAAGKPVKLVWTRGEEFTWAYFRPAGVIDIASGVTRDGKLVAWECHNYNSGGSGIRTPYEVPNQKIEFHNSDSPLRQGSYRALAATANHFARESHMDELAIALKLDPVEFRLRNLKDDRLRAVLEAAAEKFGWAKKKPAANRGFGIGCGVEKGGYVATCAEVSIEPSSGQVKVERVTAAFECGAIVNPDNLKNQVEGSVIMGIGGALFEAIEFENGKILNGRLSAYRVPRFSDVPPIDTVLLDRKDLPTSGAGETPIIGIAPAIGNAICSATGIRLRSLPMAPDGLKPSAETGRK